MNSGNFLQQEDSFRKTATATPKSKVCHCKEPVYEPFAKRTVTNVCARAGEWRVFRKAESLRQGGNKTLPNEVDKKQENNLIIGERKSIR